MYGTGISVPGAGIRTLCAGIRKGIGEFMKSTRRQNQISDSGRMPAEHRRPQPCIRAADWEPLLYDYAEGLTDRETAASVERHIAECDYCRGALEDIRWMMSALQTSVPEPHPAPYSFP